jgi:hypothetical protein
VAASPEARAENPPLNMLDRDGTSPPAPILPWSSQGFIAEPVLPKNRFPLLRIMF